jgi:hypothetical protein
MDSDEVLTVVCLIRSPRRRRGQAAYLSLAWRIDDRKALIVLLEGDVGGAERFAHLVIRHFHREIDGTVAGAILIAT